MAWAQSKRRAKKRGWPGRIVGWAIRAFFIFVIGSLLWVLLYRFVPPPVTFTMLGDLLGGRGITKDWMSLDDMDPDMPRAAIAGEDSKFCAHKGFDQDAIAEAMRRNAKGGSVIRGGSTISQQTAKNAFLWQGGGYFRKGLEAWFTLLIEQLWGKRRIMEVYLNVAETGIGTYGASAGAERYFDHDASSLSRTEAARIAAVLPLPKKRDAVAPGGFTRRYGNSIASRMRVVQRDGLDACLYEEEAPAPDKAGKEDEAPAKAKAKKAPSPSPSSEPEQAEDYQDAPDIGEPVDLLPQPIPLPPDETVTAPEDQAPVADTATEPQ